MVCKLFERKSAGCVVNDELIALLIPHYYRLIFAI